MSTTTTNYGLIKPDTTDPILVGQLNDNADVIDATLKSLSDALDVAKLGIKYKGEVNYYSNLPSSGNQIGDAYTVKYAGSSGTIPDGTEYVWGTVSGTNQWINFSKDSYTKAEVDALLALKQNALSSTQLDAVNSGINSTKVAQIATNASDISDIETALGGKVDKETGKSLSTNDFTTAEKTKLDDLAEIKSIGTGLNLDDNGELTATGGGSGGTTNYNDLSNKPQINGNTLSGNKTSAQLGLASTSDIPIVPITAIQKNGTGITPVSGTVNITVPTQASDINAATATQGDKADTAIQGIKVNNSTVTPDSNKVVSITVPTTATDVSALPDTTKYAVALSLTINSSTFVMTGQLKDQNGDNLGTAQTIDLPLESVVVGGSYNSQTKKVVLTLQNGNTIEFSVADLVSGLQTELSTSNKLNPAFIEYDSTHRAVSDTEKSAWNSKQNALSSTQLDAVNSGIDSTKVEQIETNKNNILLSGKRNPMYQLIQPNGLPRTYNPTGATVSVNADNSITVNATNSHTVLAYEIGTVSLKANIPYVCTGAPSGSSDSTYFINIDFGASNVNVSSDYTFTLDSDSNATIIVYVRPNIACDKTFYPMILEKSLYDSGFTDYQPYAMSNAELTAKRQTRRLGLWVTSFTVEAPPFGTGTIVKVYIYKGAPDKGLSEYILASESVSLVCGGDGVSYSISGSIVTFTTTSTCIAYAETLRFDV